MKKVFAVVIAVWLLSPEIGFAEDLQQPDWIPENLRVPSGNELFLRGLAVGVQIYDCRATVNGFAWVFRAPQAALFHGNERLIITHYGGPPRAGLDGSPVWGGVVACGPSRNARFCPWCLFAL